MLDVFLTVDVEVWCDGWDNIDAKFPDAFKRYIYGPTSEAIMACRISSDSYRSTA